MIKPVLNVNNRKTLIQIMTRINSANNSLLNFSFLNWTQNILHYS
jgi:hypothetical protein